MKVTQLPKQLSLNKVTVQRLSSHEMTLVNGGFTYSLSTGHVCQESNDNWHELLAENGTVAPVITGTGGTTQPSQVEKPHNAGECQALP